MGIFNKDHRNLTFAGGLSLEIACLVVLHVHAEQCCFLYNLSFRHENSRRHCFGSSVRGFILISEYLKIISSEE